MPPRLVPEISPLDAFCDVVVVEAVVVEGIGDSRSWISVFTYESLVSNVTDSRVSCV